MSYLGSTPTTQSFIAGTDTFSGTGSQVAFTLTRSVNTVNDILVVVNNVDQQPSAYTVSGTTLTMSAAPSAGTNNVYVRYMSTTLQSIAPSQGTITPTAVSDQLNTSTGYFGLPAGTTAQRPGSPATGFTRFNTTLGYLEYYDGTLWLQSNQVKNQVAFSVYKAANQTVSGVAALDTVFLNQGNCWDTTSYRFVAPTTGVYWFSASLLPNTTTGTFYYFRVNGVIASKTAYDVNGNELVTMSQAILLNTNDYFDIFLTGNGFEAIYSQVSGFFIG